MSSEATKGLPVFTCHWNIPQIHMSASKQFQAGEEAISIFGCSL